jgi:probable DNA repair protein
MIEPLLPEIENGAIVLTANRRLARSLSEEYNGIHARSGIQAWTAARIMPFGTWLSALWSDALLTGQATCPVLNETQELSLWERIVRESEAGNELLQPREAARVAAQAWLLSKQYRLPAPSRSRSGNAGPDVAAFGEWAAEFARFCREHEWITAAELPDALIRDGIPELPPRAVLCGFDEFTPQQKDFLAALKWARFEPAPPPSVDVRRASFPDTVAEYRAAAKWCRNLLDEQGADRIGVIVPRLSTARDPVERIFWEELGSAAAFHVSAGKSLSKYPVVRAALLFLKLGRENLSLSDAGAILRSPYLPGAGRELTPRAILDVGLRKKRQRRVATSELRSCVSLDDFETVWRELLRVQSPGEWAAAFQSLLEAAGWPGDVALSSGEYQSRDAFLQLLDELASYDLTTGAWDGGEAYERLTELADATEFGLEDEGAPIQVMGVLESAGSQFDALWTTGLHDSAWPQTAQPNPFLPLALQREHNLPHSSDAREFEFSSVVTARLLRAAPRIVFSWPRRENDAELRPSPLLKSIPDWTVPDQPGWMEFLDRRSSLQELVDTSGPPVGAEHAHGGTSILKNQAACPFRAFAENRLRARPLEEPEPGLGPADRGTVLHRALDVFWREVGSYERLMATPPDQLAAIARDAVEQGFGSLLRGTRLREIECDRLTGLLVDWLDVERQRAPFRVWAREDAREVEIGGLRIKTRIDRVDELPDGRQVVIDYKSNAPSLNSWEGDRPAEPQVPLYAARCATRVAAALFANLRPGELRFAGIAEEKLAEKVREWNTTLEKIAIEFAEGRAEVDPRKGACENCRLTPLCRVSDCGAGPRPAARPPGRANAGTGH